VKSNLKKNCMIGQVKINMYSDFVSLKAAFEKPVVIIALNRDNNRNKIITPAM